jgi:CDP-diacylglycerol--glycerol-3-phosphate 3-phosphatidyltransferase
MISAHVGGWVRGQLLHLGALLSRLNLSPNWFTIVGLLLNIVVAVIIGRGNLIWGGVLLLGAGLFDTLDGAVARASGQITRFGGFLDSTLDRYSEAAIYLGLLIYFQHNDPGRYAIPLTYATAIGSLMVSYTRARAEAAGIKAEVGLFARAERIILLAVFLILGWELWAVWILGILTNFTAVQRMFHVWRVTSKSDQR